MTPAVVETRGLRKRYPGATALDALDLRVPRGSIFGFLGPNGAGKSTAMKLLLGLARPTSGEGRIFGLDIVRDSRAIRNRVGYLAQEPRYDAHRTAREILRFAAGFFPGGGAGAGGERRIDESLDLVGLRGKADRPVRGFSGGERQRLGIAQAQIHGPELLILDEPAAALDPIGRRDVLAIMERLRDRTTVLYSTHILDDVERVSDAVAILDRGRIVAQGSTDELTGGASGAFTLTVRHADRERIERAGRDLAARPWITALSSEPAGETHGRSVAWHLDTAPDFDPDDTAARVLRAALDAGLVVEAFGRRRSSLEATFIDLIEHADASASGTPIPTGETDDQ